MARDLIRTGLAGGDNKSLADQLMRIERRIVALEQQGHNTNERMHSIDRTARDLLAMFEAVLKALTSDNTGGGRMSRRLKVTTFAITLASFAFIAGAYQARLRALAARRPVGKRNERAVALAEGRGLFQGAAIGVVR